MQLLGHRVQAESSVVFACPNKVSIRLFTDRIPDTGCLCGSSIIALLISGERPPPRLWLSRQTIRWGLLQHLYHALQI